jgi:hypothetical protein
MCSRCVTTVQGVNVLQREKNSHKSEAIVQYTPKTLNRNQKNKEERNATKYLNAEQFVQQDNCETVAFETKNKKHFTMPNMFSGIFIILQISRNAVYS